jgi:hypothetical protein
MIIKNSESTEPCTKNCAVFNAIRLFYGIFKRCHSNSLDCFTEAFTFLCIFLIALDKFISNIGNPEEQLGSDNAEGNMGCYGIYLVRKTTLNSEVTV